MISVIVPTFGNFEKWNPLAQRAVQSVMNQTVEAEIIRIHGTTLAGARNEGADKAKNGWLVFLDASDELDPNYIWSMEDAIWKKDGQIFQPSTVEFNDEGQVGEPALIPTYNLLTRNYLIIGSMVSKQVFQKTNGFDPSLPCLEDWDFWLQCERLGAEVAQCPEAIYRVYDQSEHRNDPKGHGQTFVEIRDRYR